ncbi:MAG: phosphopantetheine-binding protein [Alphaproteobacteria bacterium]|nr:phosphopantetheine-binding protein [Alphaproteobacteria bacterium]
MTQDDIRTAFIEELTKIAPDIAAEDIGETDHIQDDLGLDSMDVLNLVTALHQRLGVDIPEPDYPRIATLSDAVPYLAAKGAGS